MCAVCYELFVYIHWFHSLFALGPDWALGLICGGTKIFDLFEPQMISVVPECRRCNWFEFISRIADIYSRWIVCVEKTKDRHEIPICAAHLP